MNLLWEKLSHKLNFGLEFEFFVFFFVVETRIFSVAALQ
jgi:hypothetical protein